MTRESYLQALKNQLPDERRAALMPRQLEKLEKKSVKNEEETWIGISSDALLTYSKPILLWGQSGNGKTTWLQTWAIQLLNEPQANWLPIYRHCSQVPDSVKESPEQWLKKVLVEDYGEDASSTSTNILLLLDGLDQIASVEHLSAFIKHGTRWHFTGKVTIAVASRVNNLGNDIQIIRFARPSISEVRNFLGSDYSKIEPVLSQHPFLAEEPMLLEMIKELVTETDASY